MGQRDSGYVREEDDLYQTPAWVTQALLPFLPVTAGKVWECADGKGQMSRELAAAFTWERMVCSDINSSPSPRAFELNFLEASLHRGVDKIITNPPYSHATEFIEHALRLTEPVGGMVAMLLKTDFDHASTRSHLFRYSPAFKKKIVLTKRIKWFDRPVPCKKCNGSGNVLGVNGVRCKSCRGKGEKKQSPSENHSWFLWDWRHEGAPTIAYAP